MILVLAVLGDGILKREWLSGNSTEDEQQYAIQGQSIDPGLVEEGVAAWKAGVDMVGTTLSGYTPYSANPIRFGTLPSPGPDYEIIRGLRAAGVEHIVAEGRITNGEKMRLALDAGAYCVVIGTSITEPRKIVKTILLDAKA